MEGRLKGHDREKIPGKRCARKRHVEAGKARRRRAFATARADRFARHDVAILCGTGHVFGTNSLILIDDRVKS
jgi:hypothetical protein